MNDDDRAFERAIRGLLEDGSDRTSAETIDAVLLAVRTTPQERDLRIPWRTSPMSNPMRLVAAIAIAVVAGVAAINLFRPTGGVGGLPSPSPTVTPSAPAPTPSPQPSPTPLTATWTTYTSTRYGFSIGHPADWTVDPSKHVWTLAKDTPSFQSSGIESFNSPDGHVRASAWSVAVKPGTSADAWLQTYCPKNTYACSEIQAGAVAVSMDGHAGLLVRFTDDTQAFILVNNRMYVVADWRPDSDQTVSIYGERHAARRGLPLDDAPAARWSGPFSVPATVLTTARLICLRPPLAETPSANRDRSSPGLETRSSRAACLGPGARKAIHRCRRRRRPTRPMAGNPARESPCSCPRSNRPTRSEYPGLGLSQDAVPWRPSA